MRVEVQPGDQSWLSYALPVALIVIVVALRLRSMGRERPLKLETLWVVPVVYALLAGSMLTALPPTRLGWALASTGVAVGAGLGWYRGRLIRIKRDAETGTLRQRASPLAMLLLLALVALKLGARAVFGESAVAQPGSGAMLLTDAFIGFALGLLAATRLELYVRGKRLLGEA